MRRALALTVLLLCVAVGARAQFRGLPDGGGPSVGAQSQKLTLVPADQYLTSYYSFTSVPSTSAGNGWFQQQSTAAGVAFAAYPPFLTYTANNANQRALLWEQGPINATTGVSFSAGDEVTISFAVNGWDAIGASTNGLFEFQYGDTNGYLVNKGPTLTTSSFGVIVPGTGKATAGVAPSGKVTCFVNSSAGDVNDTTYVSVGSASSYSTAKVFIHAGPNNGPVEFWINDALVTTIASPTRGSGGTDASCAFWLNGTAGGGTFSLGPVTVQRAWP